MASATVKLYALLSRYLPPGSSDNRTTVPLTEGMTVAGVIAALGLPEKNCHLVLINGFFVPIDERATRAVADGDTLAIWPPVAGG